MSLPLFFLLSAAIGYLFGSIPFGLIYVKALRGIDVREIGSGRTGGTNAYRAGGLWAGALTAVSDGLKGGLAAWLVTQLAPIGLTTADGLGWAQAIAGICSVAGHNYSLFLKFRGGAGTGPNVGWATFLWGWMAPLAIGLALLIYWVNGMASVVSITMALIIPVVFGARYLLGFDDAIAYTVGGLATFGLVIWALRPNIKRIIAGTERVVGPRAQKRAN